MQKRRCPPYGGSTLEQYEVQLSPRANRDLDAIYQYIAEQLLSPDTALNQVDRIEQEILNLDTLPYRWPVRTKGAYAGKGYRQAQVDHYTIVYRVDEMRKWVIVLTVRYSASNF